MINTTTHKWRIYYDNLSPKEQSTSKFATQYGAFTHAQEMIKCLRSVGIYTRAKVYKENS